MKRVFVISLMLICLSLSACKSAPEEKGRTVVTTNFAVYDWTQAILGENPGNITVRLLTGNGADLHSYQPTAQDMLAIQNADLFIYVGAETETWVSGVLQATGTKGLALTEILQDDLLCSGDHSHQEHNHTYDEHMWLSLRNAQKACRALTLQLSQIDTANKESYQQNLEAYLQKLQALDDRYTQAISNGQKPGVVFGDRFPFLYLMTDYALPYVAAFDGCSTESDASFATISRLARQVDAWNVRVILITENGTANVANAIIGATSKKNQQVCRINAMQSVTSRDLAEGFTYLRVMEENLTVLQQALE